MTWRNVALKLKKFIVILFIEFHPAQSLAAQPVHARPERGHGQVLLVDAEPGRETRQVGATESCVHGDVQVREAARACKEAGGGAPQWPVDGNGRCAERCHAVA